MLNTMRSGTAASSNLWTTPMNDTSTLLVRLSAASWLSKITSAAGAAVSIGGEARQPETAATEIAAVRRRICAPINRRDGALRSPTFRDRQYAAADRRHRRNGNPLYQAANRQLSRKCVRGGNRWESIGHERKST